MAQPFIGLLVGLFAPGPVWLGLMVVGVLIGAAWGALLGLVARLASRGRHALSSLRSVVATHFALDGMARQARGALGIGT